MTGAYRNLSLNITGQGEPQSLEGASVTSEVFPILAVQPALGRYLLRADFEITDTYSYVPESPVACPITVCGAEQDDLATLNNLAP